MTRFSTFLALFSIAFLAQALADSLNARSLDHLNATQLLNLELKTAITETQRLSLLDNKDFVFNFLTSKTGVSMGDGGRTVAATAANFPALIGHNIAMTVGFIGPCSINLPHIHPRATEINFIAQGKFEAGFFEENGARFIVNTLHKGEVTVFPMGAIHFEQNLNCEPAVFVAAFNSEDPGVSTIGSNFIGGLPADIVSASLRGLSIEQVKELTKYLPKNPAIGIQECRKRCGL
ncbi:RmlC-like cupin [Jimgerdemannia flammicorona]|uniref:RmlC-like cupin n=1 Tax=Jimgerdemannia flammicorona TaxID=994334 RepID=A0A433DF28_9FUNG|nr:RmlC-like cupin [Jimgerdemannia flammicorona]